MAIYLVDDNASSHLYVQAFLKHRLHLPHAIQYYKNSSKFVEDYQNQELQDIDLLILDWFMPKVSGLAVLKAMKQCEDTITPPATILFTGNIYIDSKIQNSYTFVKNIVNKPIEDEDLKKFEDLLKTYVTN